MADKNFDFLSKPNEEIALPIYQEIESLSALSDPKKVFSSLRKIDWSFTNDDTRYLAHDIHPYPAKFIPQLPGVLIASLSLRGELIFDPFGGSGTAALEAVRLGRRGICIDANPLSELLGRTKTTRIDSFCTEDLKSHISVLQSEILALPNDPKVLIKNYSDFIPDIPNIEKWFPFTSCGELALIRSRINNLSNLKAKDICNLSFSRTILSVSNQDSETRYTSKKRNIVRGDTISKYLKTLKNVASSLASYPSEFQYGITKFFTADSRSLSTEKFKNNSIDFVVTSPPYGNAYDYHLYNRFRLFWLGYDPVSFGKMEIGSHLRHQKEKTGIESYSDELNQTLFEVNRMLKPGRYSAIIIGDAIYNSKIFSGVKVIKSCADRVGMEIVGVIDRPIHQTKRSISKAGRRAEFESIVILRKQLSKCKVALQKPNYKLWEYEEVIRKREITKLLPKSSYALTKTKKEKVDPFSLTLAKRLTFTHSIEYDDHKEDTWQKILENSCNDHSNRKDPKYVTHGIHSYKGKFYPQLAKSLINLSGICEGARIFDPFCGSGTTILEGYLNGLLSVGCDMNPLAAKIARAKTGILSVDPLQLCDTYELVISKTNFNLSMQLHGVEQFADGTVEEIFKWFPEKVVYKINWILRQIRNLSTGVIQDFFEIILSDIIRSVSQQDPRDLRIRRRKIPIEDGPVVEMFRKKLEWQMDRLESFWKIRGHCPFHFHHAEVFETDSRLETLGEKINLTNSTVDLILTSPPYATALPYIDTDRLSLLSIFGMNSKERKPLEETITGSREIRKSSRNLLDQKLENLSEIDLDDEIIEYIRKLYKVNMSSDVGFRRKNLPSLLLRFFIDMKTVLGNCEKLLRPGAEAVIVIGDSTTVSGGQKKIIPTTNFIEIICNSLKLKTVEKLPISVTTENYQHIKNAIKSNIALRVKKN